MHPNTVQHPARPGDPMITSPFVDTCGLLAAETHERERVSRQTPYERGRFLAQDAERRERFLASLRRERDRQARRARGSRFARALDQGAATRAERITARLERDQRVTA